jgi:thioredoxin 1
MDMNNPAMMQMAQQLMQDPETMQLRQRPGMLEKLQQLMADPSGAASMMGDPDMMTLMQKLQQSGMGGGMGGQGGGGSMFGDSPPSLSSSSSSSSPSKHKGGVIELQQSTDYAGLIQNGEVPTVTDFSAVWCGPCKMIAPVFKDLADEYAGRMQFVKVDGDKHKQLCQAAGVKGYPTFHFYDKNGKLLEQFSGARVEQVKQAIAKYAIQSKEQKMQGRVCPYKHFPLRESEKMTFKQVKFPALRSQFDKVVILLNDAKSPATLSDTQKQLVNQVIDILSDEMKFHATSFSDAQLQGTCVCVCVCVCVYVTL